MDESGIDHQLIKEYHWSPKGKPLRGKKSGSKRARTNVIAGLCCGKILAPVHYDGNSNYELVETWLKNFLLPELKEGQIVIFDNASFHRPKQIREILKQKNCKAWFLPPYSPHLNPIEQYWAWVKKMMMKLERKITDFMERLEYVLKLKYITT